MKKIFPIVLLLFMIISVFTIPTIAKKNTLRTNLEIRKEDISKENRIYLLNKNGIYVEVKVHLINDKVENIIERLKENSKEEPYQGYLPNDVKILNYEIKDNILKLDLSTMIEEKYIPGLIHSLLELKEFRQVELTIQGEFIEGYEKPMDKSIPLNIEKNITKRRENEKIVLYYIDNIETQNMVPVTKYINTRDDKIKVIIEELKTNIPNHLISYISNHLELIDYEFNNDCIILNFNKDLLKDNRHKKVILEEISKTIFNNYDVSSIVLKIEGKLEEIISNNG